MCLQHETDLWMDNKYENCVEMATRLVTDI